MPTSMDNTEISARNSEFSIVQPKENSENYSQNEKQSTGVRTMIFHRLHLIGSFGEQWWRKGKKLILSMF